ncbi:helix-turn-helix domain-containing protein [Cohnella sp. CFH 77786]|nr:helix-turn-helix domain-containing protein [Cohnella sp. CFH 77786]
MHKVLLVDPDRQSRETTWQMVNGSQWGYAIQGWAGKSEDALSLLEKQPYSLVLINIKRFQIEGLNLCSQIRQRSRIPIILIGGDHDFNLARKAMACQVSDYLADPVHTADLAASLQAVKRELETGSALDSYWISAMVRKRSKQSSIVDVVKQYVQQEMHRNVTLKKISDALHFNCAYLGRKFKEEVKMTFNEYLLRERMERAKRLLEQTDMRIYEIANEVGYTEIDWFYKKFKEYTGTSANEYRKQITFTA